MQLVLANPAYIFARSVIDIITASGQATIPAEVRGHMVVWFEPGTG